MRISIRYYGGLGEAAPFGEAGRFHVCGSINLVQFTTLCYGVSVW